MNLRYAMVVMNTLIGCYYETRIVSVSFNSFLHRASFYRTFIVVPVNEIKFYVEITNPKTKVSETFSFDVKVCSYTLG